MKKANYFINLIKNIGLSKISFFILLIWTSSPVVVYVLKLFSVKHYTEYFEDIIHIVGLAGILVYIFYLFILKEKKLGVSKFIPEVLIAILLVISYFSSIFSKKPFLAFFGEGYRKEGLIIYIMYIGFLLLSSVISDKKYIRYIFKSIIFSGLFVTVLPFFEKNFTYYYYSNIFCQFNHYGYYLMINTMLSAFMVIDNEKILKKVFYLFIYVFFVFLLIKNNTFGCFLAISISFLFLFIYSMIKKYNRKMVILIIFLFVLTSFCVSCFDIKIGERVNFKNTKGLVSSNLKSFSKDLNNIANKEGSGFDKAGSGRGLLWKEAINCTLKHPIFGVGMEHLKMYYRDKGITYNDRPHNIILQVSSFIGIPGAITYVCLIFYVFVSGLKILKFDSVHIMTYFTALCYFISSLFGNSMYYTSPYFVILLGLLIGFVRFNNFLNKES